MSHREINITYNTDGFIYFLSLRLCKRGIQLVTVHLTGIKYHDKFVIGYPFINDLCLFKRIYLCPYGEGEQGEDGYNKDDENKGNSYKRRKCIKGLSSVIEGPVDHRCIIQKCQYGNPAEETIEPGSPAKPGPPFQGSQGLVHRIGSIDLCRFNVFRLKHA